MLLAAKTWSAALRISVNTYFSFLVQRQLVDPVELPRRKAEPEQKFVRAKHTYELPADLREGAARLQADYGGTFSDLIEALVVANLREPETTFTIYPKTGGKKPRLPP